MVALGMRRSSAAQWWGYIMSRVIAIVACGFTLAACSSSIAEPGLLQVRAATEALRIESEPPGAEAKTSQGQTCRTPCELTVQPGSDQSVTLALNGYQPQTVPLRAGARRADRRRLAPNPVYVELAAGAAAASQEEAGRRPRRPADEPRPRRRRRPQPPATRRRHRRPRPRLQPSPGTADQLSLADRR